MLFRTLLIASLVLCHVIVTSGQSNDPIDPETILSIVNRTEMSSTVSRSTASVSTTISQTELRTIAQNVTKAAKEELGDIQPTKPDPPPLPKSFPFGPQLLSSEEARKIGRSGLVFLKTAGEVRSRNALRGSSPGKGFIGISTDDAIECPFSRQVKCDRQAKFRTITGVCNNLQNPLVGSSNTPFERFLPPVYDDDLSEPRSQSVLSGPLPLPRFISTTVHQASDTTSLDRRFTQITMEFGQFVSHDTERFASSQESDGAELVCCPNPSPGLISRGCFPIEIPPNDPFFSPFKRTCMEFVRASPSPPLDCRLGPREQLNQETAYLDGSAVYGSTDKLARDLREKRRGLLRTTRRTNGKLLVQDRTLRPDECTSKEGNRCFAAGDPRVNQQPALMSMHTLWLREHNRVATELRKYNPGWKDETLYQEARKIVSAEFQRVAYDEFLPSIIGNRLAEAFGFPSKTFGYTSDHEPGRNAQIRAAFSAAGYRFGHSLVQSFFSQDDKLLFRDHFLRPDVLYEASRGPSFVIKSLFKDQQQKCDRLISPQLTNTLFERVPGGGIDLAATNIQRGREFGIPSYNAFRQWCSLSRVTHFGIGPGGLVHHTAEAAQRLGIAYRHVDDIDLWTGAVSERVIDDAVVGPTIACIVGRQFFDLKIGDRFFYENSDTYARFPLEQLNQIRKATFARIICDNTNADSIQKKVFRLENPLSNPKVNCGTLPSVDLSYWRS